MGQTEVGPSMEL